MKKIPLHSLVVLVGGNERQRAVISNYFPSYEILSYEKIEKDLLDSTKRQEVISIIKEELLHRTKIKLKLGERVVVSSANLKKENRLELAQIGKEHGCSVFYIVSQSKKDSFVFNERKILQGDGVAEVIDYRKENFTVIKKPPVDNLYDTLKKDFNGITAIGDVHGVKESLKSAIEWAIGRNHFIIFLGDIIDYGPKPIECVNLVYDIVVSGRGVLVYGNHERKIEKWINNDDLGKHYMTLSEGNQVTVNAIQNLATDEKKCFKNKYKALMVHARNTYIVEDIIFTHAGCLPEMFNIHCTRYNIPEFYNIALFGMFDKDTVTSKYCWVDSIPENKTVVVGHSVRSYTAPVVVPGKKKGTALFLDTGSGKGGILSSVDIRFNQSKLKFDNFNRH